MQTTVEENLKWGFALYSSPGSFDPDCDGAVSMTDFKNLVNTMARYAGKLCAPSRYRTRLSWSTQ